MKTLLVATLVFVSGSAAMATGKIVCSNKSFSMELTPVSQTELNLKITSVAGQASFFMPKANEAAALIVDGEVSHGDRVILRSEKRSGEIRGYEMNMIKKDVLKPTFAASLNVAREGGVSQFVSYAVSCARK